MKLLELLQQSGKLTTKEIAQLVRISPTPVHERIRRLEREGVIKKYVALVEAEKVGKGLTVFCDRGVKPKRPKTYAKIFSVLIYSSLIDFLFPSCRNI